MVASEVQWIKIKVGMFDGNSFRRIKRAKIGGEKFRDKLTAVWFELMDFAGACNHGGAFIDKREIPYKDLADIATMIDRETEELELCMTFFINEGMVEIVDDVYQLSNWMEYQNEEALAKLRENKRVRQAKWRENKRLQAGNGDVDKNVSTDASTDVSTERLPSYSLSNTLISCSKKTEGDCKGETKPKRHKYGEYDNVLLSDEEFHKLQAEFPQDWKARIDRLSGYIASTGKSYKNHLATIRNWARKDKEQAVQKGTGFETGNPFLEMLNERRGTV